MKMVMQKEFMDFYTVDNLELISIHVPKTAGTSFGYILIDIYKDNYGKHYQQPLKKNTPKFLHKLIQNKYDNTPNILCKKDITKNIKCIHGHMTYNKYKSDFNIKNVKLITWVRNPIERLISLYYFRKFNNKRTIKEMVKYDNFMEWIKDVNDEDISMLNYINNINDFYFIGLTEHFKQDISILSNKMNWKINKIYHFNKSNKQEFIRLSLNDKNYIKDKFKKDIILYNDVLDLRKIKTK